MADGITKTIEDILPGDEVKAVVHQNPNGEIVTGRVVRVFQNAPRMLRHLHFGTFEIRATHEHPFYVKDKGWIAAEDLKVGDVCRSASGNDVVLLYIDYESEEVPVFNFEVEGCHSYFVGSSVTKSVLVHNECPIHSYTPFPDKIDKYLNASRNCINYYLFGVPIKTTCTCAKVIPKRIEDYSLGNLAAFSPGDMSWQNQTNTM